MGNSYKCDSGVCRHDDGDNQFALASSAPATVSLCSVLPHAKTVAIHPLSGSGAGGQAGNGAEIATVYGLRPSVPNVVNGLSSI